MSKCFPPLPGNKQLNPKDLAQIKHFLSKIPHLFTLIFTAVAVALNQIDSKYQSVINVNLHKQRVTHYTSYFSKYLPVTINIFNRVGTFILYGLLLNLVLALKVRMEIETFTTHSIEITI